MNSFKYFFLKCFFFFKSFFKLAQKSLFGHHGRGPHPGGNLKTF